LYYPATTTYYHSTPLVHSVGTVLLATGSTRISSADYLRQRSTDQLGSNWLNSVLSHTAPLRTTVVYESLSRPLAATTYYL
jgi:hypothetical protein